MNLSDDKKNSIFDTLVGNAAGAYAGHWQFKKMQKQTSYSPMLNSRSNILNRIQNIDIDGARSKAIKAFETDYAITRISTFENQVSTLNAAKRITTVNAFSVMNQRIPGFVQNHVSIPTLNSLRDPAVQAKSFDFIRSEWDAAVKATFPNPLEARTFSSATGSPFEAIRSTLKGNNSVLMQRAFYTFEKNISSAINSGASEAFGFTPVSSLVTSIPTIGKFSQMSMNDIADSKLRSTLESIQSSLGRTLQVSRRGNVGQGELIFSLAGKEGVLFNLPETFSGMAGHAEGLIRTGSGLHNVYAPGIFGIADERGGITDTMNFAQLKAQRILSTVQSEGLTSSTPGLTRIFKDVESEVNKLSPYMEPNISGNDYSLETIFRGNQITVLDANGNPVVGDARRNAAKSLYNSQNATPAGAGSRFALTPEEQLYGPFAKENDYARKSWQFIRQYQPTDAAQTAMGANPLMSQEFDFLDSPLALQRFNHSSGASARLKTLYLNESQINELQKTFNMTIGDGEMLVHQNAKAQLQVSRMKRINLHEIDSAIVQKMQNGGVRLQDLTEQMNFNALPLEGFLGRGADGRLIRAGNKTELMGISPSFARGLDNSTNVGMDLIVRETTDMSNAEKMFGSLKGMARFVKPDDSFFTAMSKVTGRSISELQDISVFARADDIKDNAKRLSAAASSFILDAQRAGISVDHQSLISELQGLKPQTGEKFEAAIDRTLGARASALGFTPSMSMAAKSGGVGVAQLYFGGAKELTGAGNIGTIEPRIFTLLEASNPGGLGNDISNEFLDRMVRWSPERVTMQEELIKTMKSIDGQITPSAGSMVVTPSELTDRAKMDTLFKRGGFVQTGTEKMPSVYIPGYETVPQLHPRMVDTGAVVDTSQPGKIFRNLIGDVKALNSVSNPISEDEFMNRLSGKGGHLSQLLQEAAAAGKGAGSIARGELGGSRALTVLSEIDSKDQTSFARMVQNSTEVPEGMRNRIVGASDKFATQMFDDMEKLYGTNSMTGMRSRFDAGEAIAGMGMRHPTIGAYSMQPILLKRIESDQPVALISEKMEDISFGNTTKSIQNGILPGLAADKDADTALAMLLSPDMESKMRQQMLNSDSVLAGQMNSFRDHSIRMQLLKPKAVAGNEAGITLADRRAAEATKLAITSEEVGILSSNLTKSRVAIMASNFDDERKLRSLSMLEWLEQQPISGKHLGVSQALSGAFEQQMRAINAGARGNANLLEGAMSSMIEGIDPSLKGLFQDGLNDSTGRFISGFKMTESSQDIANAIQEFRALPSGSQLAAASRYTAPGGSTSLGMNELKSAISANEIRATGSAAAQGSRNMIASINSKIGAAKNAARPFIKPLVVSAAVTGGVMAVLGSSPGSLPPPPKEAGQTELTNQNRDDIQMPGQDLGSPTSSPQMAPSSVQMNNGPMERAKGIRASVRANGITPEQRSALTQRLNGKYPGSRINVNIRDDRKTLNVHSVSDMID